ncbi:hypothetical protein GN958_ATG04239 [Phytophthora infestans]|uniref:Uncharacterized protein n=1 Tax=Phytophthora infestans TaxID=4787 RepID=A0A8S9UZV5_PHYIN|nr:hypothetical protein GN958_ATG04239 [Phytophthora infestans]
MECHDSGRASGPPSSISITPLSSDSDVISGEITHHQPWRARRRQRSADSEEKAAEEDLAPIRDEDARRDRTGCNSQSSDRIFDLREKSSPDESEHLDGENDKDYEYESDNVENTELPLSDRQSDTVDLQHKDERDFAFVVHPVRLSSMEEAQTLLDDI